MSYPATEHEGAHRSWHFLKMRKAEVNQDPIQGEFFTDQDIADRLVRESLQNSLDAIDDQTQPVIVRFTLRRDQPLDATRVGKYFNGLRRHLDASLEAHAPGRDELNKIDGQTSIPYLLIEDFNTLGLTGDVEQFADLGTSDESDDNHFYWFVRNVGRSGKRGLEGGSWGVGKWVFPDASQVNTFFFVTCRRDDNRTIFMGQSVLKMHHIDQARYHPYGSYAIIEDDEGFALPIDNQDEILTVMKDFKLRRGSKMGLSIIVPFPEHGLEQDALLKAIVTYYYNPILSDRLIVYVSDDKTETVVNHESIYEIVEQIDWGSSTSSLTSQHRHRMFDLVQDHATISDQDRITSLETESNRNPTSIPMTERFEASQLEDARLRFENGDVVAFRIKVWVHPIHDVPKLSWLDLIVQRDATLTVTHTEYVRNNLSIPHAGTRRARISSHIRSFLIVQDEPLASLLRDSEEPSHSRWNEGVQKVRDKYHRGRMTVRFVNGALRHIIQCLTTTQEGLHRDLLKEYFSISTPSQPNNGSRIRAIDTISNSSSKFRIARRANGFTVRVIQTDDPLPDRMRIRVAYDIRRGNPLRRYDPRDFDLSSTEFTMRSHACSILECGQNQIVALVEDVSASISVNGFDPNRDVLVEVVEL